MLDIILGFHLLLIESIKAYYYQNDIGCFAFDSFQSDEDLTNSERLKMKSFFTCFVRSRIIHVLRHSTDINILLKFSKMMVSLIREKRKKKKIFIRCFFSALFDDCVILSRLMKTLLISPLLCQCKSQRSPTFAVFVSVFVCFFNLFLHSFAILSFLFNHFMKTPFTPGI